MLKSFALIAALLCAFASAPTHGRDRWTAREAQQWYARQPWLVGANYIPANAVNQLEMWQADTFDPATIDKELGWAQGIGMNAMRVYLHNLPWEQDSTGFLKRIDQFLGIADRHGIKVMLVLFDSCWDAFPKPGPQAPPIPGIHNPGWVQAPGRAYLADPSKRPVLEAYVKGVVGAFAKDKRVIVWDVWNEPDFPRKPFQERNNLDHIAALLPLAFEWARAANPAQPLTSGLHEPDNDWVMSELNAIERTQVGQSDINSFHNYQWPEDFEVRAKQMLAFGRPVLVTEYMARGAGSTFDGSLPIGKRMDIGMFNWGLVDGKTQTRLPWDSWDGPYLKDEPVVWHHDVLHADGTPYRAAEVELIRKLSALPRKVVQ